MSDDFWGGMFDFNGDGKTTWDEEMLGLAILGHSSINTTRIYIISTGCEHLKSMENMWLVD